MKSLYVLVIILITLASQPTLKGQDYKHAIKIKGVSALGISYKYLTGFENGYELMLTKHNNGTTMGGYRVYNTPAWPRKSSQWFFCYGYGAHTTIYTKYTRFNPFKPYDDARSISRNYASVGIDGYAGLEYRILKHPFIISIDCVPNIEVFGPEYFKVNFLYTTMGISYVF